MRFYSAVPQRATAQVLGDLALIAWIYAAIRTGSGVHDAVLRLAEPGRRLEDAGRQLGGGLSRAADKIGGLPVVGGDVRGPLDDASRAAGAVVRAGQDQQAAVAHLATWLAVAVAVLPVVLALLVWVPPRVRFARRAGAARRLVDAAPDLDLFALRAMAHQPMHVLARISDDPAGAWRRGDREVIRALATRELASVGLRPPSGV